MKPDGLSNFAARDIATVIHPYTNLDAHKSVGPHVMERGEGIYMYDDQGRRLIEGMSGLWCAGLGSSNQELIDAAPVVGAATPDLPRRHTRRGWRFRQP